MSEDKKPRILFVHTLFPTEQDPRTHGGAEITSRDLVAGLSTQYGFNIEVMRGLPPDSAPRNEKNGAVPVHCLPLRRPYWLHDGKKRSSAEKAVWHFLDDGGLPPRKTDELLERSRPDILLLGNVSGIGWGIAEEAKIRNIPVIQTLHDYYYLCPASTRYHDGRECNSLCSCFTWRRRKALTKMDVVVGVSEHLVSTHISALKNQPPQSIITITNGLHAREPVKRRRVGLKPVVGYLGRISPEKGISTLVQALPVGVRLLIGGEAKAEWCSEIRAQASAPEYIEFTGFIQPQDFFSQIDLLVVPSLWEEPFGRVSIEAQQAGLPVIVSDKGGLPETVIDGSSGWIFPAGNVEALHELLLSVIANPQRLEAASVEAVRNAEGFQHKFRVDQYAALIKKLCSRRAT